MLNLLTAWKVELFKECNNVGKCEAGAGKEKMKHILSRLNLLLTLNISLTAERR